MATALTLLTAEQFLELPDNGQPSELVRGEVIYMPPPGFPHGVVCSNVVRIVGRFLDDHDIGTLTSNDAGVVTERGPDTVRGADAAFYSYQRIPKGARPSGYPKVAPNVTFEVLSPSQRWPKVLAKVGEYLDADVKAVCVLDPDNQTAHVYRADRAPEVFQRDDELLLPEISPEFRVPVKRFFE
jgi:Uma2 family endonuclease